MSQLSGSPWRVSRRDVCYLLAGAFNGWLHFCHATYQPAALESVVALSAAHRIPQLRSGKSPASQCVKQRGRGAGNFGSWGLSWGLVMGRSLKGMVGSWPPLPLCIVSFLCKSILPSISLQNIMYECVCGMGMQVTHVCMCVSICKSSCALHGGKRLLSGVFLNCFPYLLRKGLSLNLEFPSLSNLVSFLGESTTSAELLRLAAKSAWLLCETKSPNWPLWCQNKLLSTPLSPTLFIQLPSITHPLWLVGWFTVRGSLLTQRDP